ncbi:MAG TPA: DUF1570 domain-containing protein [Sphingomicrobium sp.]|nr:DUF1570 domain-containing protein [Sphingomicrobium sp.]
MIALSANPSSAAWHQAKTKHFIIFADEEPDELRQYAERLERFDQSVRAVRRTPDPPLTDANRLNVFVVKDLYNVERLARSSDVAGFYVVRASGSAAFVPRKAGSKHRKWDIDAEAIFFHEYAHHLQLQYADVALPLWVTEGFAEFFAATDLRDDGSTVIGVVPAYRAPALFSLHALSLHEMLGAKTSFEGTEFIETYGLGWLLTHFLTFDRSRHGQLDRYVGEIQKGNDPLSAAKTAFGDLGRLGRQLNAYLRQKKLPHLILNRIEVPPASIQVRALTPAEAAIIGVHMRSRSGVDKRTGRRVAADARKIAAGYPDDPFVQAALAEAEFDVENYPAAEAAADRALRADPKNFGALVLKGRARMELARAGMARADWGEIRNWFLRANSVDREAAEPLLHFYNTYLYAGARPTKNAVDGLLYALALAPRDSKLRIVAVRQMVMDNRIADARKYFAPFAFQPHAKKDLRDAAAGVVAALKAGDRSAAMGHLAEAEKVLKKSAD